MPIIATCGHQLTDEECLGFHVKYNSETCDYFEGFIPCEVYATLCAACVPQYREWYPEGFEVLETPEQTQAYLGDDAPESEKEKTEPSSGSKGHSL